MSDSLIILPSVLEELTQALHEWSRFGAGRDLLTEEIAYVARDPSLQLRRGAGHDAP